jgi:stage II sporulation protein D
MSATSSMELLKAHAVISRSWLIAQIEKNKSIKNEQKQYSSIQKSENELIKWYDREDHNNFDVCADDHCQRYQGISRSTTKAVNKAVKATTGEVLTYNSEICDARFSKCCGGIAETFENVWEPVHHPYLQKVVDNDHDPENFELTLENENNAKAWIHGTPELFAIQMTKRF